MGVTVNLQIEIKLRTANILLNDNAMVVVAAEVGFFYLIFKLVFAFLPNVGAETDLKIHIL